MSHEMAVQARCDASRRAAIVVTAAAPYTIKAVNKRWSGLCGFSPEEAVGKAVREPFRTHAPRSDLYKAPALQPQPKTSRRNDGQDQGA
jgi:hypothetical protein